MADSDASDMTLLDVRGLICPLPVLKARKALRAIPAGGRLRVLATDPLARVDIPHFCVEDGHRLIEIIEADGATRFVIEKRAD